MYVCVCNAVTERHITQAVQEGARRLRDLRDTLGVTRDCGKCASCAKACLNDALAPAPCGYGVYESHSMAPEA
jgi:bacterioferritin-associated ferredoxin